MSHSSNHLEDAVKNLIAFENHAGSDGCLHCMSKHALAVVEFLEEEAEQKDGKATELAKAAKRLKLDLPRVYHGAYFDEKQMALLQKAAREIRLSLMKEMGIPEHRHLNHTLHAPENPHPHEVAVHG